MGAASRQQISQWFDDGVNAGHDYMAIHCDQFDYSDSPVYIEAAKVHEVLANLQDASKMSKVHELYDLTLPKPPQLAEGRAWHYPVTINMQIDNIYENGDRVQTTIQTYVPPPPPKSDEDAYNDWTQDYIYPHTGTGKEEGDSAYFVKIIGSTDPDLVGREIEWC